MAEHRDSLTFGSSLTRTTRSSATTLNEISNQVRIAETYSPARRYILLVMFCVAQFLDSYNLAALFTADTMVKSMGISEEETAWIVSAYQLTFASFLLIVSGSVRAIPSRIYSFRSFLQSGRISDVYNPSMSRILTCCAQRSLLTPFEQNMRSSEVSVRWESSRSLLASSRARSFSSSCVL